VASPGYIEQYGWPAKPGDLGSRNCLLLALPEYRSRLLFRREGGIEEVPVSGDFMCTSVLALRTAALAGLGPALVVDWLIREELARGHLLDLFPQHDVTATTWDTAAWLLYPSRRYMPDKVRATIRFLRGRLLSRPVAGAEFLPSRS
jgi:DNA-binding transcriptional LysR family regulator